MSTIDAIESQLKRARDGCNLGIVTHMSGGMAMRLVVEMGLLNASFKGLFDLIGCSCIVHEKDESEWCVTFRR